MLPNTRNGYRGPRCAVALVTVFAAALVTILPARAGSPGPLAFADAWRCSADPDAATTVPGWITVAGSPSLRCA
ncbi:MAG: hypothetical protein WAM21_19065, partial [Steroidobacteraceae bacterium]